jgi:16S rRNA (guanine1207-N2)-methyltransferase
MKHLLELYPTVAAKVVPPVAILLGSPWPVTQLVGAIGAGPITCFQLDVFQGDRLKEKLAQEKLEAEVVVGSDVWDLPTKFRTVIFPASAGADYELKIDMVEQSYQILEDGGRLITLSEYERDHAFSKIHKRIYGACSEAPHSEFGSCFWSTRQGDTPRRRHEVKFHARVGDRPSMQFVSRPGTFSYGRFDEGSRAMLEVAQIAAGSSVLDLGCGNGAVGCLASQQAGPTGKITFVDSNARAVALSGLNAAANGVTNIELINSATLADLPRQAYDVVLANPPYYANSEVGRLFIDTGRAVLKPGGKFYYVTKMPVDTIPEIVETFGSVDTIENRGYTVVIAGV